MLHYIRLQDRCTVFFFMYRITRHKKKKKKKKKKNPWFTMGKNIKSDATTQVHSPGKGREALRQKVQIFRLKYGTA